MWMGKGVMGVITRKGKGTGGDRAIEGVREEGKEVGGEKEGRVCGGEMVCDASDNRNGEREGGEGKGRGGQEGVQTGSIPVPSSLSGWLLLAWNIPVTPAV